MTDFEETEELNRILNPNSTHYEVLGVTNEATNHKITVNYRLLAKKYHPDSYRGNRKPDAVRAFQRFSSAAEILRDSTSRREYDASINTPSTVPTPSPQEFSRTYNWNNSSSQSEHSTGPARQQQSNTFSTEHQTIRSNLYFLRDMLSILNQTQEVDTSDYGPAILSTLIMASSDFIEFMMNNAIVVIPLISIFGLFFWLKSPQERENMFNWNNLSVTVKRSIIELLILYNEYRLNIVNR